MKTKKKMSKIILSVFMFLLSLLIIVPLLIMILGSFKDPAEAQKFNLALPSRWLFENYVHVIQVGGIGRAMVNSFIVTVAVTLIVIFAGGLSAYIISRKETGYTKALYKIFLLGMVSPLQVVTTFGLLKMMNLIGTYAGVIMIITAVQLPWTSFVLTGFIKGVPRELDEAAFLDGASPFRLFRSIILPLLKPILATAVVSTAMAAWNEFMIPLYFFNTSDKWTMPLTVYNFFGQYQSNWNYVFADLVLTALPITILYLYCQKYVISGMTAGAVKG